MRTQQTRTPLDRLSQASKMIGPASVTSVTVALDSLLADLAALHIKAKELQWRLSAPPYRGSQQPRDDRTLRILAAAEGVAARTRKIGGMALRCLDHMARMQRLLGDAAWLMLPHGLLAELHEDIILLAAYIHDLPALCGDAAETGLEDGSVIDAERQGQRLTDAARRA